MSNIIALIKKSGLEALTSEPYHFEIREEEVQDRLFITVNYHQIKTKIDDPVVREARGVILDVTDPSDPVLICLPFLRFYNHGQKHADEIDPTTAKVQDKLDGSLIKFYFCRIRSDWIPASRNLASLKGKHLDLWNQVSHKIDRTKLDQDKVYMFELIGPENMVVVQYHEPEIYHLGTRCMKTLEEVDADVGVPKPKHFDLTEEGDFIEIVKKMIKNWKAYEKEGVVIVDSKYRRNKVKAPSYLLMHHSKGNNIPIDEFCMRVVLMNEQEEVAASRPELAARLATYEKGFNKLVADLNEIHTELSKTNPSDRDFAVRLKKSNSPMPGLHFLLRKGKIKSFEEELRSKDDKKAIRELIDKM